MTISQRSRNMGTGIIAAGGVAIALLLAGTIGNAAPAAIAENVPFDSITWAKSISLVGQPRSKQVDQFPSGFTFDSIDVKSSIKVGEDPQAAYWMAPSAKGELCFIVTLVGPNYIGGASCASEDRFNAHGIGAQIDSVDGAVRAYLVPDGLVLDGLTGFTRVSSNVLVGDAHSAATGDTLIRRSSETRSTAGDEAFVILPFGAADGSWKDAPK